MTSWMRGFVEACTSMVKIVVLARDGVGELAMKSALVKQRQHPNFLPGTKTRRNPVACSSLLLGGVMRRAIRIWLLVALRSRNAQGLSFGSGAWKRG